MSVLDYRNAFEDHADIPSRSLWETQQDGGPVRMTIAIPAFRRPDLLMEAIESALAQRDAVGFEILIVDDDPVSAPDIAQQVWDRFNASGRPIRYLVNEQNLGLFGNWNRCIEAARGEWLTILNDDDVLHPEFLSRCHALIEDRPDADGIVGRQGLIDRRLDPPQWREPPNARNWILRSLERLRFGRSGVREPSLRSLFFGNEIGNGLAFLFRRQAAIDLGGYYVADWPSSDYYFYVRFILRHRLYWVNETLGYIGLGANESMRPDTLLGFIHKDQQLREALLGTHVPAAWRNICPMLVSLAVSDTKSHWNIDLDREALAKELSMVLPAPSLTKIRLFRAFNRGY